MKQKRWIMMLVIIMSSFSMKLAAQESVEALIKKCETMESVDISVTRTMNPETKKLERDMTTITICKDPALVNQFVAVFKKDEEKAIKVMENRRGGQIVSLLYQYENVTYSVTKRKSFTQRNTNDEDCYNISIITRPLSEITTRRVPTMSWSWTQQDLNRDLKK